MKYFYDCKTKEEAKLKYHDLCKRNHPDVGGSNEVMKDINRQYDDWNKYAAEQDLKANREQSFYTRYSQSDKYASQGHQFYGAGFEQSNKYTDTQGREYASRFERQTNHDIFNNIPSDHPIRNYCKMQEERIKNLHKYNDHLQQESKTHSYNSGQAEHNLKLSKFYENERNKIKSKYDRLKEKYNKLRDSKVEKKIRPAKKTRKKKCATEPNVENVIAL